jgi:hypothetical protein
MPQLTLLLQGQALNLSINGITMLVILAIVGAAIGWNVGIRALLSISLLSIVAYPLFVRGGQGLENFLNQILAIVPALVATVTGGAVNISAPTISLDFLNLGPLVNLIAFVLIAIVLAWLIDRINLFGWYAGKPGNDKERQLGAVDGILLALLVASVAAAFAAQGLLPGGLIGQALAILPDVGLFPVFAILLLLLVLFLINLPKVWVKPPPPKK